MRKHFCAILIIASAIFAYLPAKSATELNTYEQQIDTLKKDGIDPVCKMKVKAGSIKTHIHNKVVYGFCSDGCKRSFLKQPEKYLKK
ncbi:YHS domain-containing protein [Pedobacter hiemivivus]|uniref:YHS domain-containing protein n=1 Tax=Pedobacter hiemivivus TaxID=2530454 RepID=A0A4R0N9T5_9SPHI|nr:YHS domain-containing protein [Pedobacter hiemivivus]TCC96978.1 YHS domain-containing protein [Pedobacter hiemivivus]